MKPHLYLIPLSLLGISMMSCEQPERNEKTDSKSSSVYEEAFIKAFGNYSYENSWNTAKRFSLDITPGEDGIVKIYAPCKDTYRLVAYYSHAASAFTAQFDAPVTSAYFVVDIGGNLYYAEPGGQVSARSAVADNAKVSDVPLQWILAVENDFNAETKAYRSSGGIDFDFNDVLIGIRPVVTDDEVSVDFIPLACGDNQPFYIHIKTNDSDQLLWPQNNGISDDCEFHQWFGIKDYTKGVNTGINSAGQTSKSSIMTVEALTAAISGCHLSLPSYWTLSNYSHIAHNYKGELTEVWGIYITVGTYKGFDYVKDNTDYGLIGAEGVGTAPRMLLFPDIGYLGEWRWPCEGNSIGTCYPVFCDWARSPLDIYSGWHEWLYANDATRERY